MKKLEEGLGWYRDVDKTKAYYKALPGDGKKALIEKYMTLDLYERTFMVEDVYYITLAQYQR